LVRQCIELHISPQQLDALNIAEASEREQLRMWANKARAAEGGE